MTQAGDLGTAFSLVPLLLLAVAPVWIREDADLAPLQEVFQGVLLVVFPLNWVHFLATLGAPGRDGGVLRSSGAGLSGILNRLYHLDTR